MFDSIIILGPTATGKTGLAIALAKALNTEIINADSMYIYKNLNIGTAKPDIKEMQGIRHHLIDIVEPSNSFNVAEYRELAKDTLQYFSDNNLVPIIVGGTGFYIDSYITTFSYGNTEKDTALREKLYNECETYGNQYLHDKLKKLDEDAATKININDTKRIIRAIEICMQTNKKLSEIENSEEPLLKNPLIIGLNLDREMLYNKINLRVDKMLSDGLLEEVKQLYKLGINPENNQSMKGIGYKEIIDYLRGVISLDDAIEKIKQHTRNYAKRQITWFKRNKEINWFDLSKVNINSLVDEIINMYNK